MIRKGLSPRYKFGFERPRGGELRSVFPFRRSWIAIGILAVFDAIFDHYGVQRVRDQEEWTTALILFSTLWPIGEGGEGKWSPEGFPCLFLLQQYIYLTFPECSDSFIHAIYNLKG